MTREETIEGLRALWRRAQRRLVPRIGPWSWRRLSRRLPSLIIDCAILLGTTLWIVSFKQVFGWIAIALFIILLQWRPFERFFLVRLVYFLICFLFVDSILTGFLPLRCISWPLAAAAVASIPATLWLSAKYVGLSVRFVTASFLPALSLIAVVVGLADRPSAPEECRIVRSQPGVEVLVDLPAHSRGLPRYLVFRPEMNDLLILYRGTCPPDRFDLGTRVLQRVEAIEDECIGMYWDRPRRRVLAVTCRWRRDNLLQKLVVLDENLKLVKTLEFADPGANDYNAYFAQLGPYIAIQTDMLSLVDPDTLEFAPLEYPTMHWMGYVNEAEGKTGFLQVSPTKFYLVGGMNALLYNLMRMPSVYAFDLANPQDRRTYHDPFNGFHGVCRVPERNELLFTTGWRSKVVALSEGDLRFQRSFDIGPCVRSISYDPVRRVGRVAESFSGYLDVFDVTTGRILDRKYVGKNSRAIYETDDLGTVVLSSCGVIRVN